MKRLLLAGLFAAALVSPAAAQTVKWKFGSSVSAQDIMSQDMMRFAARVKEATGGRLDLEVVPLETIGFKNVDSLRVLKQGVLEAMLIVPYYVSRDAPLLAALMPQGALIEPKDNLKIEPVQREIAAEIYKKWNIVSAVDWHSGGLRDLVVIAKEPISSLAQLKNKKFRHFTKDGLQAFNDLGISTQIVPSSELYLALKTGVVDAAVYGLTYAKSQSLNEVTCCASYLAPFTSAFPFTIGVREDAWAKLPDDLKKAMQEVGRKQYAEALDAWLNNKLEDETRAYLEGKGMKMLPAFPVEDRQKIQQSLFKVWREQCEKLGPDAVRNYDRIMAALQKSS